MSAETPIQLADPRDKKKYYFQITPLRRILTPVVSAAFQLISIREAIGVEHLPSEGPVVLAANHVTEADVFLMQFVLPRPIFFMGKAELFQNPLLDALLRQLGGFPVQRGAQDEWALRHARQVLERGQVLGIFPEGRRNWGRGLHPGKTGVARLAIAANCPIVPLAINGTHRLFAGFPRRTNVTLTLGEPLLPQAYESALALTDRLMFTLAGLLPPEQRGVYAEHPKGF